jgi:hypothetical protein
MQKQSRKPQFVVTLSLGEARGAEGLRALGARLEFRNRDAARKRKARAWDKTLGRRADGHTIRPV